MYEKLRVSVITAAVVFFVAGNAAANPIAAAAKAISSAYDATAGKAYEAIMKAEAIKQTQTLMQNYKDSKAFYKEMEEMQKKGGIDKYMADEIGGNIRRTNKQYANRFSRDIQTAPQEKRYVANIEKAAENYISGQITSAGDKAGDALVDQITKFRDKVDFQSQTIANAEKRAESIEDFLDKASEKNLSTKKHNQAILQAEALKIELLNNNAALLERLYDNELAREQKEIQRQMTAYAGAKEWNEEIQRLRTPTYDTVDPIKVLDEEPRFTWESKPSEMRIINKVK